MSKKDKQPETEVNDLENDSASVIEKEVQEKIKTIKVKKKSNLYFFALTFLLIASVPAIYLMYNKLIGVESNIRDIIPNIVKKQEEKIDKPTPTPEAKDDEEAPSLLSNLVFFKQGELWTRKDGVLVQLTDTNKSIYSYDVNYENSLISYVSGNLVTNENGYQHVQPREVSLLSLSSNETKTIHTLEPSNPTENQEYSRELKTTTFFPSGKKIAITSSNAFWVFDIDDNTLKEIFFNQEEESKGMVYAYHSPVFSKNEDKVVLGVGYYEGSSQLFVDIKNNQVKDLPYTSYVSGKKIVSHMAGDDWMLVEYGSSVDNDSYTKISSVNISDLSEEEIVSINDLSTSQLVPLKDFFILFGQTYKEEPNEDGVMIGYAGEKIITWNKNSGTVKTVSEWMQTEKGSNKSISKGKAEYTNIGSNNFYLEFREHTYGDHPETKLYIQKYNYEAEAFELVEENAQITPSR
ncbi:hypothetical protein ACFL1M_04335 [Patescibacteria group bacterium]